MADVKELQRELKKLSRVQRFLDGVDIKRGRQSYQKGRGGQSYSTTFRAYIMKQFVNGAEPAPLHESLKDAYLFFLPKEERIEPPSLSTLYVIRQQIQPLAETLAAKEAAEAEKWIQLGHDGSEINQVATLTCNVKLQSRKVLSLRGCYYTKGTTAKLELEAMNSIIENGQSKLRLWWESQSSERIWRVVQGVTDLRRSSRAHGSRH